MRPPRNHLLKQITSTTYHVVYDNINKPIKINFLDKSIVPAHNIINMKQIDDMGPQQSLAVLLDS